jgi:hypothetical protein
MRRFSQLASDAVEKHAPDWALDGHVLTVWTKGRARHQDMRLSRVGGSYAITSTILGPGAVRRTDKGWRRLALIAWQRNAEQGLVTFGFDKNDRLVGQVVHPADHLDVEELDVYVQALSQECDRLEYLLSGKDVF